MTLASENPYYPRRESRLKCELAGGRRTNDPLDDSCVDCQPGVAQRARDVDQRRTLNVRRGSGADLDLGDGPDPLTLGTIRTKPDAGAPILVHRFSAQRTAWYLSLGCRVAVARRGDHPRSCAVESDIRENLTDQIWRLESQHRFPAVVVREYVQAPVPQNRVVNGCDLLVHRWPKANVSASRLEPANDLPEMGSQAIRLFRFGTHINTDGDRSRVEHLQHRVVI